MRSFELAAIAPKLGNTWQGVAAQPRYSLLQAKQARAMFYCPGAGKARKQQQKYKLPPTREKTPKQTSSRFETCRCRRTCCVWLCTSGWCRSHRGAWLGVWTQVQKAPDYDLSIRSIWMFCGVHSYAKQATVRQGTEVQHCQC